MPRLTECRENLSETIRIRIGFLVFSHWVRPRQRDWLKWHTLNCIKVFTTAPMPYQWCHWLLLAISLVSLHILFLVSLTVNPPFVWCNVASSHVKIFTCKFNSVAHKNHWMCSDRIDMDRCEKLRGNIRKYFVEGQSLESSEVTPLTFRAEHSNTQGPSTCKVCTMPQKVKCFKFILKPASNNNLNFCKFDLVCIYTVGKRLLKTTSLWNGLLGICCTYWVLANIKWNFHFHSV